MIIFFSACLSSHLQNEVHPYYQNYRDNQMIVSFLVQKSQKAIVTYQSRQWNKHKSFVFVQSQTHNILADSQSNHRDLFKVQTRNRFVSRHYLRSTAHRQNNLLFKDDVTPESRAKQINTRQLQLQHIKVPLFIKLPLLDFQFYCFMLKVESPLNKFYFIIDRVVKCASIYNNYNKKTPVVTSKVLQSSVPKLTFKVRDESGRGLPVFSMKIRSLPPGG